MAQHITAEPRHTATVAANILDAIAEEFETDNIEWIPVSTLRNIARRLRNPKEPPLKARGISVLRSDHTCKDIERGQRGSSAKNDDVDVVWRLGGNIAR